MRFFAIPARNLNRYNTGPVENAPFEVTSAENGLGGDGRARIERACSARLWSTEVPTAGNADILSRNARLEVFLRSSDITFSG